MRCQCFLDSMEGGQGSLFRGTLALAGKGGICRGAVWAGGWIVLPAPVQRFLAVVGQDGFLIGGGFYDLAVQGDAQPGIADNPYRIAAAFHAAAEQGVIGQDSSDASHNAAVAVPEALDVSPGFFSGHPFGVAGFRGNFAVQGHGVFHCQEGHSVFHKMEEDFIECTAFFFQNAGFYGDAVAP